MGGFAAIPAFLITMAMLPAMGFAVWWLIGRMIEGALDAIPGLAGIIILCGMFAVSISSPNQAIAGAFLVVLITGMVFFPYAETQMARVVGREVNAERIEKAHAALSARSDNVAAWFELSRVLYDHGFQGHAIAIADLTLSRLSENMDPIKFQSMRDLFRSEEYLLQRWKRDANPDLCKPLRCPKCSAMNPPGDVSCSRCGAAYLLEIVRGSNIRKSFLGRLVFGWTLLAGLLCAAAYAGVAFRERGGAVVALILVGVVGLVLWLLFRAPKGDQTMNISSWS